MLTIKKKVVVESVVEQNVYTGYCFRANYGNGDRTYTLLFVDDKVVVVWTSDWNKKMTFMTYSLSDVQSNFDNGHWVLVEGDGK